MRVTHEGEGETNNDSLICCSKIKRIPPFRMKG
jgi:hypothetical protein